MKLKNSNIESKMITGDSLFIAVETAKRAGIIDKQEKVVFLQGKMNADVVSRYEGHRIFTGILISDKE